MGCELASIALVSTPGMFGLSVDHRTPAQRLTLSRIEAVVPGPLATGRRGKDGQGLEGCARQEQGEDCRARAPRGTARVNPPFGGLFKTFRARYRIEWGFNSVYGARSCQSKRNCSSMTWSPFATWDAVLSSAFGPALPSSSGLCPDTAQCCFTLPWGARWPMARRKHRSCNWSAAADTRRPPAGPATGRRTNPHREFGTARRCGPSDRDGASAFRGESGSHMIGCSR